MQLETDAFRDGGPIPGDYAFCVPDPDTVATLGPNRNPGFVWSGLPEGTRSLVLICHDVDAPTRAEVDAAGDEVPAKLPRSGFYHWVLVDLRPERGGIREGEFSEGVTPGGKGPGGPEGTRQGRNGYTEWFSIDADMKGTYFGYDGPCPPPTDSIPHHYTFTLFALDVDRCSVEGEFTGDMVLAAIEGHVLGKASLSGTYVLNPRLVG